MLEDEDPRHPKTVNADLMVDEIREVAAHCKEMAIQVAQLGSIFQEVVKRSSTSNTQTVIHKNEGMGNWGVAAVTACFLTYLTLSIFAIWAIFAVNNLQAWRDIFNGRMNAVEYVTGIKSLPQPTIQPKRELEKDTWVR